MILETGKGTKINCDAVTPGSVYPVLHIHTPALTFAEAGAIFSDPEQTAELTVMDEDAVTVYTGFTVLYSVQQSPFISGDLLIWLNKENVT